MLYKYNYNKRHNYIRKNQRKKKTINSKKHNLACKNYKNVISNLF